MLSVKTDYIKRQNEIDEYFSFVSVLTNDIDGEKIKYNSINGGTEREAKITDQLQKVLLANGFLLLYNLIEATVRNSICEIFLEVLDNGVNYSILSNKLKDIWINQNTSNLKGNNFKIDTLNTTVSLIAKNVMEKEVIALDKEKLDFSGNLDARKIRDLALKYGFTPTSINADNLVTIKNKRNHLAHGDFSFSEIGKDFTIGELLAFKTETFLFLNDVVLQVESFINTKGYLLSPIPPDPIL